MAPSTLRTADVDNPRDDGFTLIELFVVILIIGILAAIAVPAYLGQRTRAHDSSLRNDLHTVATQMEDFFTDYDAYPAAASVVDAGNTVTVGPSGTVVTLSSGNVVTAVASGAYGYCLHAVSTKTHTTFDYDSQSGGLQPKNSACQSATF